MKTFKKLVSEVAQPKSPEERAFKDQHVVQKFDYPVKDSDAIFKGTVEKKKRPADYDATSDKAAYDKATPEKAPFKLPRDIDESAELEEATPMTSGPKGSLGGSRPQNKYNAPKGTARHHADMAAKHQQASQHHADKAADHEDAGNDSKADHHYDRSQHHDNAADAHKHAQDMIKKHGADHPEAQKASKEANKHKLNEALEQLDEISKELAQRYYNKSVDAQNKAMNTMIDTEKARKPEKKKAYDDARKTFHKRGKGSDMAAKRLAYKGKNEEVEQVDEISKDKVGRYLKKAMVSTSDAGMDTASQDKDIRKRGINTFVKRRMGTSDAVRKLTGKARVPATESVELSENPMEEKPMMMNALRSMSHNMQGIAQYVAKTSDPEEWFQNKLAGVAKEMQTLYSYATAETMSMGEEAAVAEEKKITAKDMKRALAGMKVKGKDEVSLKKAPWEKKEDVNEVTQSATKKMVNITGPDGKVHTVMKKTKTTQYDDKGQEKIKTNESFDLAEGVKVGNMKLRDGSSVKISSKDAKLINQMMKDLNAANRRKMEKVMMMDKAGFEEILGFAREAM